MKKRRIAYSEEIDLFDSYYIVPDERLPVFFFRPAAVVFLSRSYGVCVESSQDGLPYFIRDGHDRVQPTQHEVEQGDT